MVWKSAPCHIEKWKRSEVLSNTLDSPPFAMSNYSILETGLYENLADVDNLGYAGHVCSDRATQRFTKPNHPLHFKQVVKDSNTYQVSAYRTRQLPTPIITDFAFGQFLIEKVEDEDNRIQRFMKKVDDRDDRLQLYTVSNQGAPVAQVGLQVSTILDGDARSALAPENAIFINSMALLVRFLLV